GLARVGPERRARAPYGLWWSTTCGGAQRSGSAAVPTDRLAKATSSPSQRGRRAATPAPPSSRRRLSRQTCRLSRLGRYTGPHGRLRRTRAVRVRDAAPSPE